jgi:dihydroneopterin aldolase/2-amino-4-hydroxy-6-hydroxymethyldihydropteridine diphosphokinase/dihydropteroate synthase
MNNSYASLEDVLHRALAEVQEVLKSVTIPQIKIRIVQLKPPLHCKDVGLEAWSALENGKWEIARTRHFVTDFVRPTIIGVNDVEREEEQDVVVNVVVETQAVPLDSVKLDFRKLTRTIWTVCPSSIPSIRCLSHSVQGIGKTSYLTLEALTTYVAKETLTVLAKEFGLDVEPLVTVSVAKPCALVYADASEVQITRIYDDFQIAPLSKLSKAVIAFGSNLEDRFHNIEYALRLLEDPSSLLPEAGSHSQVSVTDTSFLYETAPMYVTDQPAFINGACLVMEFLQYPDSDANCLLKVETNLAPVKLLQLLKTIESKVGRVPTIRNGPRIVDLDIIFYDDLILDTRAPSQRSTLDNLAGELLIPHPRIQEREFALRPITEYVSFTVLKRKSDVAAV